MDASPFIKQDRTYVPVRYLAEPMGALVGWDEIQRRVTLTFPDKKVELFVGRPVVVVNGEERSIPVAPVIKDSRTYLPARFVAEAVGYMVDWEPQTRTVIVWLRPQVTLESLQALVEQARREFPPEVASDYLKGVIPGPAGLEELFREQIGAGALEEIRSDGREPTGREKDIAAACLKVLCVSPQSASVRVVEVATTYPVAPGGLSGWFSSGQPADLMLSGVDFNQTGGPLLFNHPKGIASDGTRLLLADGNNNRILIWNHLPVSNSPPDLVLGQPDFNSNDPGNGRGQLNWPVGVATDGKRVVVADTNNDRILIWNQFPTRNGQPADIVLDGKKGFAGGRPTKSGFSWPWGVWTDGNRLVISSTRDGYVLVWNKFPWKDDQPADICLTAGGDMGTPRTITSDGQCLIVGDHNARNTPSPVGNFFWKTFPTRDDQPYDYFRSDPVDSRGAWMTGAIAPDGRLVMLGATLHVWNSVPATADEPPALSVSGYRFDGGDGASLVLAGGRVYISLYNGNKVVVYDRLPSSPVETPAFAIGAPDPATNTLDTHYVLTNGVPATDGTSLFVSSDFDRKLYVWKRLPDKSGSYPDLVYVLPSEPWDNELWRNTLVLAGKRTVLVWSSLPVNGQPPDAVYRDRIGSVEFGQLTGVALDDTYFYLSDAAANKVYVWKGLPAERDPDFAIPVESPFRLSSDGRYLVVTTGQQRIYIYRVSELSPTVRPVASLGGPGVFNLPQNAIVSHGSLFVADTNFHRVHIWKEVEDALQGQPAQVILGQGGPGVPPLAVRDGLFMPGGLAFDGSYLWVGEFKFSFRVLRFSVRQ
ncbi:MAG: stalk domain-containing protein [Firmicutes bacterium]|nr:stalk domain-containing protein [Bacillota bacterium]